jgi:uncharacterized membrane protein
MEPTNNPVTQDNGKTAGIISYFTIIGWLIAYFAFHQNNKTSLGSYQLRQTLLLHIVFMIVRYGLAFILGAVLVTTGVFSLYYLLWIVNLVFFVVWIIGLIGAINGEEKPIPIIGPMGQKMFPNI